MFRLLYYKYVAPNSVKFNNNFVIFTYNKYYIFIIYIVLLYIYIYIYIYIILVNRFSLKKSVLGGTTNWSFLL